MFISYSLLSSISHCSSFFSFIFGCCLLIAFMYYRYNFESFDLLVCLRASCCVFYCSFLSFRIRIISFGFNNIVPLVVIFLSSFLHLISAFFPTFYKRKSGIFRFTGDKRSLFGIWSWVSFLRIPHSFKFLVVLQFSLACLGVICRMYVCTTKINFQSVDFFVFF